MEPCLGGANAPSVKLAQAASGGAPAPRAAAGMRVVSVGASGRGSLRDLVEGERLAVGKGLRRIARVETRVPCGQGPYFAPRPQRAL